MTDALSIWIVGKDRGDSLPACIESCRKLARDIRYLDMDSSDGSTAVAGSRGIPVMAEARPTPEFLAKAEEDCRTPWVLFLRPEETVSVAPNFSADSCLADQRARGFSLVIREEVPKEGMREFQWIRQREELETDSPGVSLPVIEIRLVRRSLFRRLLKLMMTRSGDDCFPFESNVLREIDVSSVSTPDRKGDETKDRKETEMKFLRGELSCDTTDGDKLEEFSDRFLIFSVLTMEDVPRYYRGLEKGFGSERMYLTMLHYLAKFGRFREAVEFFQRWEKSWGFFDSPVPYRIAGFLYAHLLEMDEAVRCYLRYLSSEHRDARAEVLSFLGKAYLLQGRREEAVEVLERSQSLQYNPFDHRLLAVVTSPGWRAARLSVCIIARDEENTLPRTLQSVAGIADEVILVDTGSKDGTRDIAAASGCRVIGSPWQDDFAGARNAGLREATGDYILCLDADEFIDSRERLKFALFKQILPRERHLAFRTRIEAEEPEEEMLVMLHLPKQTQADCPVRIFPAQRNVFFESPAFETAERSLADLGIEVKWNDVFKVTHARQDRPRRERRKDAAVRAAFSFTDVLDIAWKGFVHFLAAGDLASALPWLERCNLEDVKFAARIVSLYALYEVAGLDFFLQRMLDRFPSSVELQVAAADYRTAQCRHGDVVSLLEPLLEAEELGRDRQQSARARFLDGLSLLETGDLENGVCRIADARDLDPWNLRYKIGGIYALAKAGHWEGVARAVEDVGAAAGVPGTPSLSDFSGLALRLIEISRHFLETGKRRECSLLQKVAEMIVHPQDPTVAPPSPAPAIQPC
ncbi:MAG TPA: glycosyltransferase [Syntrophales bacterium]|nr:glycosyltransferase [Syntrophales bacterium]